jgi:membrane protein YdbS with pleckstrin-like domain
MSFGGYDLMGLIGLIVLGLVIVLLIKIVLVLIPAILVAIIVWWFSGSTWWAGLAFLVIAALSILKKL